MKQNPFFQLLMIPWTLLFFASIVSCSPGPGRADCNRYYNHLVKLIRGEPGAIQAAVTTGAGKSAVVQFCMEQERASVKCALEASSLGEWKSCEDRDPPFWENWKP